MPNFKLMLIVFAFLSLIPLASAGSNDTDISGSLTDPGITPDSPLWRLDIALDKLRYAFAFGAERKVAVGLQIAEERLAEMKAAAEAGDAASLDKAKMRHDIRLNKIYYDVRAAARDDKISDLIETAKIKSDIDVYEAKLKREVEEIEVETGIKETLPPEEKVRIDSTIGRIDTSVENLKANVEVKHEETRIKLKEKTGLGDGELDEIEGLVMDKSGKEEKKDAEEPKKEKLENDGSDKPEKPEKTDADKIGRDIGGKLDDRKDHDKGDGHKDRGDKDEDDSDGKKSDD